MAAGDDLEIERKFLVSGSLPLGSPSQSIRQIYINPGAAISVRLREADGVYTLTLKKGRNAVVRTEFNIPLEPQQGARMMANFGTGAVVEKQRHVVTVEGMTWEVDVFSGVNQGLVIAEIELTHELQAFAHPHWLGREVSHDPRFTNQALFLNPFSRWGVTYAALLAGG